MSTGREPDAAAEPGWLRAVRLRCLRRVLWCRELWSHHHYEQEQSLAITHSEVERALVPPPDMLHAELGFYSADEQASALTAEIDALADGRADPRWARLASELELSPAESALLAAALAAELAPALRRVYGYLQDEVTALDATPLLAGQLWTIAAPRLGAESGLVRWRLARPLEQGREPWSSSAGWIADPAVLAYLLDEDRHGATDLVGVTAQAPSGPRLHQSECDDIVALIGALAGGRAARMPLEIELIAPGGAGKTVLAARVAERLGRPAGRSRRASDRGACRSCHRRGAGASTGTPRGIAAAVAARRTAAGAALDAVLGREPVTLLATETPLPVAAPGRVLRRSYALAPLDRAQRVRDGLRSARGRRRSRSPTGRCGRRRSGPPRRRPPSAKLRYGTCAPSCCSTLRRAAQRLPLPYTWEDLVVAAPQLAHLRELEAQARLARGGARRVGVRPT